MRRIAVLLACLVASAALVIFLVPARASALTAAGLHKGGANGAAHYGGVELVRRGGGGFRGGFHGGFRGRAFRGGFHGGRAYAWRGGVRRAGVWRGGRAYAWRGGRRHWRGPRWGWAAGPAALAAPYYYRGSYGGCPLVRRTVWTPYGYRVRWVRRCY